MSIHFSRQIRTSSVEHRRASNLEIDTRATRHAPPIDRSSDFTKFHQIPLPGRGQGRFLVASTRTYDSVHYCTNRRRGNTMEALEVVVGDITKLAVDVVVNAANETLLGGGGVDGAIHRAAGPELLAACKRLAEVRPGVRCPTGEARLTPAFALPARWIVHTVGPIWRDGNRGEAESLSACYDRSLELAAEAGSRSVAFPAISTGVYGFPKGLASQIASARCEAFLLRASSIERIVLVAFSETDARWLRDAVWSAGVPHPST